MTPAINAAKKAGIAYNIHEYQHDPAASSYGKEAAEALQVEAEQIFKTLLIACSATKQLVVAIIPVSHQLNLKSVAKVFSFKKVTMADPAKAEASTGYILGGISPLGQKKRLPCVIDASVSGFKTVFVSAGRRGLEIELSPQDLIKMTQAKVAEIHS